MSKRIKKHTQKRKGESEGERGFPSNLLFLPMMESHSHNHFDRCATVEKLGGTRARRGGGAPETLFLGAGGPVRPAR